MSPWDKNHTQLRINELASIRGNIETKNSPIRWGRQDTRKFFFYIDISDMGIFKHATFLSIDIWTMSHLILLFVGTITQKVTQWHMKDFCLANF